MAGMHVSELYIFCVCPVVLDSKWHRPCATHLSQSLPLRLCRLVQGTNKRMPFNRFLRSLVVCAAGLRLSDGFLTPLQVRRPRRCRGRVGAGAGGSGGAPCDKRCAADVLGYCSTWLRAAGGRSGALMISPQNVPLSAGYSTFALQHAALCHAANRNI